MRDKTKKVTWKHLKPGTRIHGYSLEGFHTFAPGTVVSANTAYVTYLAFDKDERKISSEAMFEIDMTQEEINRKYKSTAKKVVEGLKNTVSEYEAGPHEMWNSWIRLDPLEMAATCEEEDMSVIGCFKLDIPNICMFGDDELDIGIVAQYNDTGEKFWCHAYSKWLDDIFENWEKYVEEFGE